MPIIKCQKEVHTYMTKTFTKWLLYSKQFSCLCFGHMFNTHEVGTNAFSLLASDSLSTGNNSIFLYSTGWQFITHLMF